MTRLLALLALLHAGTAQAAETCMPPAEAEALIVALLPDAVEAVAQKCTATLPPAATLRAGLAPLVARWRSEGATAQANAGAAVAKLMGNDLKGGDPAAMLSLTRTALMNGLIGKLTPTSCADIDRAVTLAAPLPARNLAGLFVMLAQVGAAGKKGGDLPICKATRP